ncbi:MAG: WS/DGAT domain-containing protein, partial [Proteobacteria bacterium]|nr:WS/DGAT domain-containing protein [Pseudomonadota bacterium]
GRARRLAGIDVPFEPLRAARAALGVRMVDLLLAGVAGAAGAWHRAHHLGRVTELQTLVPINLRPRAAQGFDAGVGNRATGIVVRLPIRIADPRKRCREIHRRVEERKAHPAAELLPQFASLLATLPRPLYRTLAYQGSKAIDLIVTNVPGVPVTRYVAGAEIEAAYPFAPVAPHCPISVALYGYRDRLFVGVDADATAVPDVDSFCSELARSFEQVVAASR